MQVNILLERLHAQRVVLKTGENDKLVVDAPNGVLTSELRGLIALHKSDLLSWVKRQQRQTARPIAHKRNPGDCETLSYGQQRLWLIQQTDPDSTAYNIALNFKLRGSLDLSLVERSIQVMIERHHVLRTTFPMIDGEPVQQLQSSFNDVVAFGTLQTVEDAECRLVEHAQTHLNLVNGPLLKILLLSTGQDQLVVSAVIHHIVFDNWSRGPFVRDFLKIYKGLVSQGGQQPKLPELPIQYADYAVWQRQRLQGEYLQEQLGYWKERLNGAPALLELPTDRPRPAVQTYRGAALNFQINAELTGQLTSLAQAQGATLFMVLQAAFKVLLSRYSGQDDICVGTPIAGRNRAELEGLIGFFVNTLVLRDHIDGQSSVEQLLGQVKETALQAYAHQEVPFEQLVEELKPQRSLSYSPLFQVMFILQNAPQERLQLESLSFEWLPSESRTAKFDLTCSLTEGQGKLWGSLEYNTDLFDKQTIQRLAKHYEVLLEGICRNPQAKIKDLPLLTKEEEQQILVEWNDTAAPYPKDKAIHQLFEEQVGKDPNATAVVYEEEQLSYGELNARANQLAHKLRELGVGPEVLVGICVERSLEMVVGLLGILKAGGAYVPLDPSYPKERLAFMLADANPRVLLTQERLTQELPSYEGQVLCLDKDWAEIEQSPQDNPANQTKPENLAYVIYTSGSTGVPKGSGVCHSGVVNLLQWYGQLQQEAPIRALLLSSQAFDLTQKNIYTPLIQGGELHLPVEGYEPESLGECISSRGISVVNCTPSMFYPLLKTQHSVHFKALRHVFLGGEPIKTEEIDLWLSKLPDTCRPIIHNSYGPTECSDVVSYFSWRNGSLEQLPIGKPIPNIQLYILDECQHPVPQGVTGQLYVGGVGVGRGYLNRPELTAEKFIKNLFSQESGSRLYKTGDLARYLADGNIEYLGRIDNQVKLRGFRIELGEIESALQQQEGVAQSVVVVREDEPGDKRLVAYVVGQEQRPLEPEELRAKLKAKLPEYMVPGVYVQLEQLPLTPNGKVDRKALPAPSGKRQLSKEYVEPRTETEKALAKIWMEVLKVDKVGVHDNFFELGGSSLSAVTCMRRAGLGGLHVTLAAILTTPSLAKLAEHAGSQMGVQAALPTDPQAIPLLDNHAYLVYDIASANPADVFALYASIFVLHTLSKYEVVKVAKALEQRFDVLACRYVKIDERMWLRRCRATVESRVNWAVGALPDRNTVNDIGGGPATIDAKYLTDVGVYRLHCIVDEVRGGTFMQLETEQRTVDRRSADLIYRFMRAQVCDDEDTSEQSITYSSYAQLMNHFYKTDPLADQKRKYWKDKAELVDWYLFSPMREGRPSSFTGRGTRVRWRLPEFTVERLNILTSFFSCSGGTLICAAACWAILESLDLDDVKFPVRIFNTGVDSHDAAGVVGPLEYFYYIVVKKKKENECAFLSELSEEWKTALRNSRIFIRTIWKPVPAVPDKSFGGKIFMSFLYDDLTLKTPPPMIVLPKISRKEKSKINQECIVSANVQYGVLHLSINLYEHCFFSIDEQLFFINFTRFLCALERAMVDRSSIATFN